MPRPATLKPTEVKGKVQSWCVSVPPHLSETGKRQRFFYATKRDALTKCEALKARKEDFGSTLASLSAAKVAEAAECYKLLEAHPGVTLLGAVRGHLDWLRYRTASVPFRQLFEMYLEAKRGKSTKYLRELRIALGRFRDLHDKMACEILAIDLEPILNRMGPAARNATMRYLRAVFRHGLKRGLVTEDPIARLDFADVPRKEVKTIPAQTVSKMLRHALQDDLELLPFLTLGFFCGIRPDGELQKLEWSDVNTVERVVVIRPEVSKTNRRRFVDLSANACAWVEAYRNRGGLTHGRVVRWTSSNLRKHRQANFEAAGIKRWIQQGMRHTYCSNWLALHGDVNKLVLQSGHDSVDTMWRSYHRGVTRADAEAFWAIMPSDASGNVIPFAISLQA